MCDIDDCQNTFLTFNVVLTIPRIPFGSPTKEECLISSTPACRHMQPRLISSLTALRLGQRLLIAWLWTSTTRSMQICHS